MSYPCLEAFKWCLRPLMRNRQRAGGRRRRGACPYSTEPCNPLCQAAGGWAVGAGAEVLARLLADMGALIGWLPNGYARRLAPLLAYAPQQARTAPGIMMFAAR